MVSPIERNFPLCSSSSKREHSCFHISSKSSLVNGGKETFSKPQFNSGEPIVVHMELHVDVPATQNLRLQLFSVAAPLILEKSEGLSNASSNR